MVSMTYWDRKSYWNARARFPLMPLLSYRPKIIRLIICLVLPTRLLFVLEWRGWSCFGKDPMQPEFSESLIGIVGPSVGHSSLRNTR
jgi:hypothetical protein